MKFKCNVARELLISIVGIGLLSFFLTPAITPSIEAARRKSCMNNLRQLHHLGIRYASAHDGQWPDAIGGALWRSFSKTSPPLLDQQDIEVLICPLLSDEPLGNRCDYLGPRNPASSLKPRDALGACTHGRQNGDSRGSMLLKDGSVHEVDFSDPLWGSLTP